jgi:hypothetical protein
MFPFIQIGLTDGYALGASLSLDNHAGYANWHAHLCICLIKIQIKLNIGSDAGTVFKDDVAKVKAEILKLEQKLGIAKKTVIDAAKEVAADVKA